MTWRIVAPEWTWWSKATSIPVQQPLERSASTVVPQMFWWSLVTKFIHLDLVVEGFNPSAKISSNWIMGFLGSLSRDKTTFYRKPPPRFVHFIWNLESSNTSCFQTHTHTICTLKHWTSTSCPLGKNTFGQWWEILHSTQSLKVPHTFVDCKRGFGP